MIVTEAPSAEFIEAFTQHRPALLRHCYRMLGSFADAEDLVQDTLLRAWRARASYAGDAPISHWLMRIATNACLNALSRGRRRQLPQLDNDCADENTPLQKFEATLWVTPAPDSALFRGPDEALEAREAVAIAFVALLQRLPPRQRAVLLLKEVVGWPSDEIAASLQLTVSSVSSALHRARAALAERPHGKTEDPTPEVLREYIRCWEERDLEGLVARLRDDVVFAMPPYSAWFEGSEAMLAFMQRPPFAPFWAKGLRAMPTRANGLPAIVWYSPGPDGVFRRHSIHVMRFEAGQLIEATNFIGDHYLHGFDLPKELVADAPRDPLDEKTVTSEQL
jgi:RNA polymerase sigma-70 factor (ECF subfamily)